MRGQAVYQQQCLRCHGADGKGEGVDAPHLPMWPPTLNGSLLWKRLDGELFWRIRHGLQARDGCFSARNAGKYVGAPSAEYSTLTKRPPGS